MNYIRTFLNKSCVVVKSKLFINNLADSFDFLRLVVTWSSSLPLLSLGNVLFVTPGFYGCDVWAEADKIVKPCLSKGMTAYYEIVGFLPNGGYIQKNYDYG